MGSELADSLGYSAIGLILSAIFLGIITIQSYSYFRRFLADPPLVKFAVALLWVTLTFQLIVCCTALYSIRIAPLSATLRRLSWVPTFPQLPNLISAVVSQGFFVYTTYRLSPNIFLLLSQLFLLLLEVGFGIQLIVTLFQWSMDQSNVLGVFKRWNGHLTGTLASVCDLVTAGALAWSINKRAAHTSRKSIFKILGLYVISTGLFTGTVSGFLAVAAYYTWTPAVTIVGTIVGSVSTVSFLSNLHSRSLLYASSGKSKAQGGGIASMFVTVVKEVDRESNYEGQNEYELRARITRFQDIVEESKTFDEAPAFEHTVTRSDSFSSCPQADLTITVVDSRQ